MSIGWAEVIINEFFIESAEGTQIPQYIELYNTSNTDTVSLLDWSIETWLISDDCVEGCGACGCSDDYIKNKCKKISPHINVLKP